MTTPSGTEPTPKSDPSPEGDVDTAANVPDGSGTDASPGDAEQDITSGGSPEDANNS